jgi:predicted nucleotidyltransferase component of viral defense system
MIGRDEIEQKSAELNVGIHNVERDYVFGWVLAGIYAATELKEVLILKGGNCLRKAYFEFTRFSNDLDFSTTTAIDREFLRQELNRACEYAGEMSGVEFDTDSTRVDEPHSIDEERKIYKARLYFLDFYGRRSDVLISIRVDVTEFDRIFLPIQHRYIIHPYSDADQCRTEVRCLKLEENLAAKLKCLLQRRHIADLFDYVYAVFVSNQLDINRVEVATAFFKKTIFEASPSAARNILSNLPFEDFKDFWHKSIVCPKQSILDYTMSIEQFKRGLVDLFSGFTDRQGQLAFFPPNLRNPIMDAGRNLTLLRVNYNGYARLIEPYSLVYKRRKDGVAREYLYVYDRTGGSSRDTGIKSFVSTGFTHIENTDEAFEPRETVEIAKAGEYGDDPFFSRRVGFPVARGRSVSRSIIRPAKPGWIYTVRCSSCNREFEHRTRTTVLRKHKDRFGNRCFGKRGIIIAQRFG